MQLEPSAPGRIQGVWVYDRAGQEVIGSFAGDLNGNVLQFQWEEPAQPVALRGAGYLVFQPDGMTLTARGHDVLAAWLATIVNPLLPAK